MWLTILYKYTIILSYLSYFSVFDFKIKAPTCHTLKLTNIDLHSYKYNPQYILIQQLSQLSILV
jgi:hypothetical protein